MNPNGFEWQFKINASQKSNSRWVWQTEEYDKHMQMTEYLQASPNFYLHLANLCFSLVPPFESLKWSLNIQKIN